MSKALQPPGLKDPSRRKVSNKVMQDEGEFLKYSCETGGEVTECTLLLKPHGGNPLHYHRTFTETFTAVSGRLGLQMNNDTIYLSPPSSTTSPPRPGDPPSTLSIPPHTPHRFFNPSATDDIRCAVTMKPGSPGFEKSIYIAYGLANDGLCDEQGLPKRFLHLCVIAGLGDIQLVGGWREWVANVLGRVGFWWAGWTGEVRELERRYFSA